MTAWNCEICAVKEQVFVGTDLGLFPPAQGSSRPAVVETAAK